MEIKRRDFLKVVAGGGLLLASGTEKALAISRQPKTMPPDAVGMFYDATICIGCKVCQKACKTSNEMPPEFTRRQPDLVDNLWDDPADLSGKTLNIIKAYRQGSGLTKNSETDGYGYVQRHCRHCIDPACVSACPVSALTKDPKNGVVSYNKKACIGCRYCQLACPFNVPKFEFDKPFPQIRKCQFCNHLFDKGGYSACCQYCPTGASIFGPAQALLEEAKKRLTLKPGEYYDFPVARIDSKVKMRQKAASYVNHIYGEKEVGGTQYFMLSGIPFDKLGFPALSEQSDAALAEGIQHTLYKGFILPGAVLAGLMFAAYRSTKHHE